MVPNHCTGNEENCIGNELDCIEIWLDCMGNEFDRDEKCKMYFTFNVLPATKHVLYKKYILFIRMK